jgi:hypothetical protein
MGFPFSTAIGIFIAGAHKHPPCEILFYVRAYITGNLKSGQDDGRTRRRKLFNTDGGCPLEKDGRIATM